MNNFLQDLLKSIDNKNNINTIYKDVMNKLLPNIKQFNKDIKNLNKHYNRACIAAESCYNYIIYTYPNYINNANTRIYNLQVTILYNWRRVEMSGFSKKTLIIALYHEQHMYNEIYTLNNILWLLKRDNTAIATIKKALEFIEFYERKYTSYTIRLDYRNILSEYI